MNQRAMLLAKTPLSEKQVRVQSKLVKQFGANKGLGFVDTLK